MSTPKTKLRIILLLLILLAAGAAAGLGAWQTVQAGWQSPTETPASGYQTSTVRKSSLAISVLGNGKTVAVQSYDMAFPVSGTVASLSGKAGDPVSAGQELASLDSTAALRQTVANNQLALQTAQKNLDDLNNGAASALASALADQSAAEAALAEAQNNLHDPHDWRCPDSLTNAYYRQYLSAQADARPWQALLEKASATQKQYYLMNLNPILKKMELAYLNYTYCQAYTPAEIASSQANLQVAQANLAQAQAVYQTLQKNGGLTAPGSGSVSFDMSLPPVENQGWGDPCTQPIVTVLYRLWDADGDMYQQWWQRVPTPAVAADPAEGIYDGQEVWLTATGYDLGEVRVAQCELVAGVPGACDPATVFLTNTSPGDNWPLNGAQVGQNAATKQVLDLGGREVDCATAPGACAFVVSEPYRDDVVAWAPLTFDVPVSITLEITLSGNGTIDRSGRATVNGTISASEALWVHLTGTLRQQQGRTCVVVGHFSKWQYVDPSHPKSQRWTAVIKASTRGAFIGGKAELRVHADLGNDWAATADAAAFVKLTTARK